MLLSATWMLRHLGLDRHADQITNAVNLVLSQGKIRTPDLGGKSTTSDYVMEVIGKL